jgi:hypothetical protein
MRMIPRARIVALNEISSNRTTASRRRAGGRTPDILLPRAPHKVRNTTPPAFGIQLDVYDTHPMSTKSRERSEFQTNCQEEFPARDAPRGPVSAKTDGSIGGWSHTRAPPACQTAIRGTRRDAATNRNSLMHIRLTERIPSNDTEVPELQPVVQRTTEGAIVGSDLRAASSGLSTDSGPRLRRISHHRAESAASVAVTPSVAGPPGEPSGSPVAGSIS